MTEINTSVRQVTVYVDGARISRGGKITLEPGSNRLEFPNLPLTMDTDSVRAKASGTARAKILSVDVKKTFYKKAPAGKVRELKEQIEKLEDEDRALADEADSINEQIKHVDGLAGATEKFAASLAKGKTTIESQAALIDFFSLKRMEAQTKLRKNVIKRRDLGQEINKVKKELKGIQNSRPDERYSALIEVEINEAGDLDIELMYNITGARWKPIYDIRLLESELEITYLGQVIQTSGEEWSAINLSLSTAPPTPSTMVPELAPWYISPIISHPPERVLMKMQPAAAAAPPAESAVLGGAEDLEEVLEEIAEEPQEAAYTTAEISRSGASVTYKIPNRVDISGDGSFHKAAIANFRMTPRIDYVTAPKIEARAYRQLNVENESNLMLLPGLAQIFENEDFIGNAPLKLVAPGETIEIFCGTDDRIRVERKLVKRETDKKFLKDKRRIQFAYEIEIDNHTGEKQTITVRDQIPVSRHEDIRVKLEDEKPGSSEQDELNRLEWEMVLPHKDKKLIRYDFSVEYPRNMQVNGLP
jgi:uncharacterized protein (TIGR02231 family)